MKILLAVVSVVEVLVEVMKIRGRDIYHCDVELSVVKTRIVS